jgi:phosphate transport system permease protein
MAAAATAHRRLLADRTAALLVRVGGLAVIASILAIVVFISVEVVPLTAPAKVSVVQEIALPPGNVAAVLADEHKTHAATVTEGGLVRIARLSDGDVVHEGSLLAPLGDAGRLGSVALISGATGFSAATSDGRVVFLPIEWSVDFHADHRVVRPTVGELGVVVLDPDKGPIGAHVVHREAAGDYTIVAQLADRSLVVLRRRRRENPFTGAVTESEEREARPFKDRLRHLLLGERQRLYGAGSQAALYAWSLEAGLVSPPLTASAGSSPVTSLGLLIGGRSLVVGQEDGSLSVWIVAPRAGRAQLVRAREFPRHVEAIRSIAPSRRDRSFFALDDGGGLGLYFSTSERLLWSGSAPGHLAPAMAYAPKADAAFLAGGQRLTALAVENPHPEVSLKALFGRVWYEGYAAPEHVWQSSSGTDDFEPKLSLTPLFVGTLKGTIYSLLIAIPLAVLGAMYASQFMHPNLKRIVKPAVEIMAAFPSVVLGFLAGLWVAPRIEQSFPALILVVVFSPILTITAGALWQAVPRTLRNRLWGGSEIIVFVAVLAFSLWLSLELSRPFEKLVFAGNFQSWLLEATGLRYDQRNAIVVGLAMGFAVIPIIFAIAEEAFSNVPRELISASLALGANRWQTVTRVVLPTASAGIFSAIMVGFGRAVGETMIVLMATGNTPILDWSPFNGFRTLSANIAVEIPEAPQYGTLYRVLFLAALLLFVLTFIVNTAAELIRQRLRERYARL